jgi:hypothetical protein
MKEHGSEKTGNAGKSANAIKAIFLFPDRTISLVIPLMFKEKNGKSDKMSPDRPDARHRCRPCLAVTS